MTQQAYPPVRQRDETPNRETELSTLLRELPWSDHPPVPSRVERIEERELNVGTRFLPALPPERADRGMRQKRAKCAIWETSRDVPIVSALLRETFRSHHITIQGQRIGPLVGAAPDGNATDES